MRTIALPGLRSRRAAASWTCIAACLALAALALAATSARAEPGPAVAWGENVHSQLGTIFKDSREETPVTVEGQSDIVSVAAGDSGDLAVLAGGSASSWGGNISGQLGDGSRAASWEKGVSHVAVAGLSGVAAVAAGGEHSLALTRGGRVEAWGNNQFGELGSGTGGFESETHEPENLAKPVASLQSTNAIGIATGVGSDFAVMGDHTVRAWGWDRVGQLGVAIPEPCRLVVGTHFCPEYECRGELGWQLCSKIARVVETIGPDGQPAPIRNVTAVAAGLESAYALLQDGHVLAWGANQKGQLGIGPKAKQDGEVNVPPAEVIDARTGAPLSGVVSVAAGFNHALALLENGEVVGWGNNEKGALGALSGSLCGKTPCDLEATHISGLGMGRATAVSAGVQYSLVLTEGRVYAFGNDEQGQLGDGRTTSRRTPKLVAGLEHVTSIFAGGGHAVALLAPGTPTPRPPLALQPGHASLALSWTGPEPERLLARTFEPHELLREPLTIHWGTIFARQPGVGESGLVISQFEGKPLESRPYQLRVTTGLAHRAIVGTPLP